MYRCSGAGRGVKPPHANCSYWAQSFRRRMDRRHVRYGMGWVLGAGRQRRTSTRAVLGKGARQSPASRALPPSCMHPLLHAVISGGRRRPRDTERARRDR
eukprot:scaffold10053_cov107-Isochrysis_galbana.AAC.1